ncbi:MAG: hypothetical protein H6817_11815 [Phycisphaerales bacterium]|nr:hypothetical protein [Phycisphaerales bacterium]
MHCRVRHALGAALLSVAMIAGCGTGNPFDLDAAARLNDPSACPDAPTPANAGTLVVLDWAGGTSRQTGERDLAGFDLSQVSFSDGTQVNDDTLAAFQSAVLARVQTILCDLDPLDVAVIAGKAADFPDATIVHLTADEPATQSKHIGQSDFDPCNAHEDDEAIIWGGALATYMPPMSFEQWVNVVANTTAHEIGHTLGFTHPSEETVARLLPIPSEEIMRATVKPSELSGEQRFLIEQNTCPGYEPGEGSYALTTADEIDLGG